MVKNMEIKANNTENMTNKEINSLIQKLYQSKPQASGGGTFTSKYSNITNIR